MEKSMTTYKFLSLEWMTATEKMLKVEVTPQSTDSATISIALTVEKCPDGGTKTLVFETERGTLKTFKLVEPAAARTEFGLSGDYHVYERVFKGTLDPMSAVMSGELHFSGNMFKALGLVKALQPLFGVLAKIPTEF
jgi:putative sterol carrier protein